MVHVRVFCQLSAICLERGRRVRGRVVRNLNAGVEVKVLGHTTGADAAKVGWGEGHIQTGEIIPDDGNVMPVHNAVVDVLTSSWICVGLCVPTEFVLGLDYHHTLALVLQLDGGKGSRTTATDNTDVTFYDLAILTGLKSVERGRGNGKASIANASDLEDSVDAKTHDSRYGRQI